MSCESHITFEYEHRGEQTREGGAEIVGGRWRRGEKEGKNGFWFELKLGEDLKGGEEGKRGSGKKK